MQEKWVTEISNWLVNIGFECVDKRLDGSFCDILMRFKGVACEVIVGREKLQWYIGIAPQGGKPVMLPEIWACYLDGTEPDVVNVEPLNSQIDFIYGRLGEAVEAVERDSDVGDKLRAINRKLMRARLGLDPDVPGSIGGF